ncbi:hypothetical protein SH501x_004432 [Pirellulaceae bacterium SH501]
MDASSLPKRVSGAFLLLSFASVSGILISIFYSGYLAIAIGMAVQVIAIGTKQPTSASDRSLVSYLSTASILLGVGAILLGIVTRFLASMT